MSIPARQDETNEHRPETLPLQAFPWASDPRREKETSRLQQAVIEAARRLGRDTPGPSSSTPGQPERQTAVSFRLAEARSKEDASHESNKGSDQDNDPQIDVEEMNRRIWAKLMPKFVAPPPQEPMSLPGLGMSTGLVGAVVVAAAIALVVVNVVQIPTIGASGASEDDVRSIQSSSTAALGGLTTVSAAEPKTPAADAPSPPAGTLLAAVSTTEIATPRSPAPTTLPPAAVLPSPQPSPEVEVARPEIATAKPAAVPRPTISLSRNEIASLLRRGQDLIAAGDIASARLVLTHLAEAGDAEASLILAGTYDPAVLATRRIIGVQPDPAKARAWYARAAEQGSSEAKLRLDQSALR